MERGTVHWEALELESTPNPIHAIGRSVLLPGWEQRRQERSRSWAFLGVDVAAGAGVLLSQVEGHRVRGDYRDWAWERARSSTWTGARKEGEWDYYETMSRFERSGRFDMDPASPDLRPEEDLGTHNGLVWRLAREIYLPGGTSTEPDRASEEYRQALNYYRERAIAPEFAWDWDGDSSARSRFRSLIRRSDDAFRTATYFTGALLANRFVAVVDAYLLARSLEGTGLRVASSVTPLPEVQGGGWVLGFTLSSQRTRLHP